MGTGDEQLLHSLLARNEVVTKEIEECNKKCVAMAEMPAHIGIERTVLEELYLYLKENVYV